MLELPHHIEFPGGYVASLTINTDSLVDFASELAGMKNDRK